MRDAAGEAVAFATGRRREDLAEDRQLVLSLIKLIEIVGEAAANTSRSLQAETSHIPWSDIIGMRHRLTHGYFSIDLDRVWDTVIEDLTPLRVEVEQLIRRLEDESEAPNPAGE